MSDASSPNGAPGAPAGPGGEPEPRAGRQVSTRTRLVVGAFVVLLVAVVVASLWTLPDYAIVPGSALDVGRLVSVPASVNHEHRGSVWLTDVDLVRLRAIDYLLYRLNSDDAILPIQAVNGPATPAQYVSQGTIDMANARRAATVVGLNALGYHVVAKAAGVIVYQPEPGSPAASALADDDVVVAVDAHPVATFEDLAAALSGARPGEEVLVTVHAYGAAARHEVRFRLGEERVLTTSGLHYGVCVPAGTSTSLPPYEPNHRLVGCMGLLGSVSEQDYATTGLPFKVSLDPAGIIGPSAGLAYTLALMEELDPKDLTGGRKIAATGTMSTTGQIGDVGGVAQKTVAVRNAGVRVFFVPTPELATARAHAAGKLQIFAVSSMSQVLADLRSIGGSLATPPSAGRRAASSASPPSSSPTAKHGG